MDHQPAHEQYYQDPIWHDSPLTDDEREDLRDAIRTLILGIKQHIDLTNLEHPGIAFIELNCERTDPDIEITVWLNKDNLETTPITDNYFGDDPTHPRSEGDPHYLRDLGHTWNAVEFDIISELVLLLDLPEYSEELTKYLLGDPETPNLSGTESNDETACFTIFAYIPQHVQTIYDNADFDLANQLRIPIEK
jgi:hypothetical protein